MESRQPKEEDKTEDPVLSSAREALRAVIDPELGLNILDLGLVRRLERDGEGLDVELIMTTPACPLGSYIVSDAERQLKLRLPHIRSVVRLRNDIAWNPNMVSASARAELGMATP